MTKSEVLKTNKYMSLSIRVSSHSEDTRSTNSSVKLNTSVLLGFDEIEYHQPRPLSETYQVPPAARGLMDNYQVPPTARPYFPPEYEIGYMEMHPPG
jgi:hypothetical protein